MSRIKYFAEFSRLQSVGSIAIVSVSGAVITLGTVLAIDVLLLFIFGVLQGIGCMSLNDLLDYDTDRKTSLGKVLVRGDISLGVAKGFVIFFLLYSYLFAIFISSSILSVVLITCCCLCGIMYNVLSKVWVGSGILAGGWMSLLILFSSSVVDGFGNPLTLLLSIFAGLFMFEMCSCQGSLKDIRTDPSSLGLFMGSQVTQNNMLRASLSFILLFTLVKVSQVILIGHILLFADANTLVWGVTLFLIMINVFTFTSYIGLQRFNRKRLCKKLSITCFSTLIMVGVPFMVVVPPLELLCLMIIPLVWFIGCNRILYGTFLRPRW